LAKNAQNIKEYTGLQEKLKRGQTNVQCTIHTQKGDWSVCTTKIPMDT